MGLKDADELTMHSDGIELMVDCFCRCWGPNVAYNKCQDPEFINRRGFDIIESPYGCVMLWVGLRIKVKLLLDCKRSYSTCEKERTVDRVKK